MAAKNILMLVGDYVEDYEAMISDGLSHSEISQARATEAQGRRDG